jgi:hypothetical protein
MAAKQKAAWDEKKRASHGEKIRAALAARGRGVPARKKAVVKRSPRMTKLVGGTTVAKAYDRYDAAREAFEAARAALLEAIRG